MAQEKTGRATQTQMRIKLAFTELIDEKGLDALTVSDLTRRARINRGTFYLHFIDKYDLLEQLEGDFMARLEEILLRPREDGAIGPPEMFPRAAILESLEFVSKDLAFVSAIAGCNGDAQFSTKLRRIVGTLLDQGLATTGQRVDGRGVFGEAYARELVLDHVLTIVSLWLKRGGPETPGCVADMISSAKDLRPSDLIA